MPLLELHHVHARYGDVRILHGVSLSVDSGEIVAVIGRNAAGKTTLLRGVSGVVCETTGQIIFDDEDISGITGHQRTARGIVQVPQGRGLFPAMSAMENLMLGGYLNRTGRVERIESMFELFPELDEFRATHAGDLSGGQQQMLAIARALVAEPKLLLLDEPSVGLAPVLVQRIFSVLERIRREFDVTVLLVEQDVEHALRIADRGYVLEDGTIGMEGPAAQLLADPDLEEAVLGIHADYA